jgi:hypothetical protein
MQKNMAKYNENGLMCEADGCAKNANGETTHPSEDTLKSERLFFCYEHLDAYNKGSHHL